MPAAPSVKNTWLPYIVVINLVITSWACNGPNGNSNTGDAGADGGRRAMFESCTIPGISARTECATLNLPLDHMQPGGETISTHVVRILSRATDAPQIWMLQGGPGGSGIGLARTFAAYQNLALLEGDLYFLDHRGTGRTALLTCSANVTRVPGAIACSRELNETPGDSYLDHISSEESSRDLAAWIDATREPGRRVIAYGVSYGTFWLSRFLEFFPNKLDGAISDGLFFGPLTRGASEDNKKELALRRVLADCARDTTCNTALGGNPEQFFRNLKARVESGHCSELGAPALVSNYPLFLATSYPHWIPALATRISRCNAEDIAAIRHMEALYGSSSPGSGMIPQLPPTPPEGLDYASARQPRATPPAARAETRRYAFRWPTWQAGSENLEDFSEVLNVHISVNEIFPDGVTPSAGDLLAPVTDTSLNALVAAWADRSPPMQAGYPSTTIPWLFWNGTHDFQTDYDTSQMMAQGSGHTLDTFPGSGHAVLTGHYFTQAHGDCAMRMFNAFAANPSEPVDRSCLSTLTVPSMSENARLAAWLFGTPTLYAPMN